jgi:hypothetical protein
MEPWATSKRPPCPLCRTARCNQSNRDVDNRLSARSAFFIGVSMIVEK